MHDLLAEALKIVRGTEANDTTTRARGRRAHARVLATIRLAESTDRLGREKRIANLLMLAQGDQDNADWALAEARRMLTNDNSASPVPPPTELPRAPRGAPVHVDTPGRALGT